LKVWLQVEGLVAGEKTDKNFQTFNPSSEPSTFNPSQPFNSLVAATPPLPRRLTGIFQGSDSAPSSLKSDQILH
jgi:hypothetical protein